MNGNEMNDTNGQDQRPLTFGEKAVGLNFNPSGDPDVHKCKMAYALLIDNLDAFRKVSQSVEASRMCSVAITGLQTSQMWAVKALTWRD